MSDRQAAFDRFFAQITHPGLRDVARHWNDVRGAKLMPAWRDIDPMALARHLPMIWAWRYDRVTEQFTGRLCGEMIREAFGRSLRGARMDEFFLGEGYPLVYVRHRRILTEPCFSRDHGAVFRHVDRVGHGERIILPLGESEIGDTVFGATIYDPTQMALIHHARVEFDNLEYFPLQ
ncbi:MAG TPA: PAS domain-containing protein [Terriglobales bacterium]|nr:PAS domain-containing protein [Terriglobales bacterium]